MMRKNPSLVGVVSVGLSACLLLLVLVHAACAQAPPEGKPKKTAASAYYATVFAEMTVEHSQPAMWCYQSDPAFVFSKDRLLLRSDLKGNITQLKEAPHSIANLSCSDDGNTIWFRYSSGQTVIDISRGRSWLGTGKRARLVRVNGIFTSGFRHAVTVKSIGPEGVYYTIEEA